jgi:hypothetical protein
MPAAPSCVTDRGLSGLFFPFATRPPAGRLRPFRWIRDGYDGAPGGRWRPACSPAPKDTVIE